VKSVKAAIRVLNEILEARHEGPLAPLKGG